jgi:hypothetical protein
MLPLILPLWLDYVSTRLAGCDLDASMSCVQTPVTPLYMGRSGVLLD